MKTLTIGRIALVWGKRDEIEKVALLEGDYHVHKDPKGGPRKPKGNVAEINKRLDALASCLVYKRDCQRWGECMDENPAQKLVGCGSGDDVCDGYLPPKEGHALSDTIGGSGDGYAGGVAQEFTCKCENHKGWISDDGKPTTPCPSCGRVYKGAYSSESLSIEAIEQVSEGGSDER
jgi:hypothetical protein